jgi:spore maturation protein CgeB
LISTNNRKEFLSDKEYYKILSESKISINFSYGINCHQTKGRVFDSIFYECLVIEEKNSQITNFFEPGKEIVFFENKEDLLNKILYYLENDFERKSICRNAKKKLLEKYNPKKFWENLLIN